MMNYPRDQQNRRRPREGETYSSAPQIRLKAVITARLRLWLAAVSSRIVGTERYPERPEMRARKNRKGQRLQDLTRLGVVSPKSEPDRGPSPKLLPG